jgi:repressor LexA
MNSDIGENIRRMRKKRGSSQTQLAIKLGYKSKSSIAKIETGNGDVPRNKLPQFAEALNCSISYLTGWNELKTFDDEHREKTPYDILCDKISSLSPSDMENVSDYIDFVINKRK